MQNDLFSDLSLLLPYLADLDFKVQRCRDLIKHLDNAYDVQVHIVYECDIDTVIIGKGDTPFNLAKEVKLILEDSIDEYQKAIQHLNTLSNPDGIN
jgi:hypothetical protein